MDINEVIKKIKEEIVIAMNPGHTPETPGKRSPDGKLLEWQWNLQAADKTAALLRQNGFNVEVVRAMIEKESLTGPVRHTNAMCKKYGKQNVLFISLHCNAAKGTGWQKAKGWEIWTSKGQTESDVLANCIYFAAEQVMKGRMLRADKSDGDMDKEADYCVLKKTACPAVLLESGFMNDKEECEYLLSDRSKEETAQAVLKGLEAYIMTRARKQLSN